MTPPDTSLPDWIEIAYEILVPHITERNKTVTQDEAAGILLEETGDELVLEPADAEYAVEHLLNRGYFYEVDGELRVTDPNPETAADA